MTKKASSRKIIGHPRMGKDKVMDDMDREWRRRIKVDREFKAKWDRIKKERRGR